MKKNQYIIILSLLGILLLGGATSYHFFFRPIPAMKFLVMGAFEEEVGWAGVIDYEPEAKTLAVTLLPEGETPGVLDEVDGYFQVDDQSFINLIDALDGVPMEVPTEITYRDVDGNTYFSLEPGLQNLSGESALYFLRYLGPGEREDERIDRQIAFLQALGKKCAIKENRNKLPELIKLVQEDLETNLGADQIIDLSRILLSKGWEQLEFQLGY
jgi:hypothetical protein